MKKTVPRALAIVLSALLIIAIISLALVVYKGTLAHVPPTNKEPTYDRQDNATAQCKDGIYSYSTSRAGTCSGHGGVKQWLY